MCLSDLQPVTDKSRPVIMSPSPPVYNMLPTENIGQTIDGFFRWLEREQNAISRYFDHHPSVRGSFFEAVQRLAGHESPLTPVATPAANALDEDPAGSDFKKHANLTAPVGSAIVDGTVGPFIANNEHLDQSLQENDDKCVEQAGKDDQPYLSAPPAASDDLAAVTTDLESSSLNNPTQARTVPQEEAKRKRKRPVDSKIGAIILSKIPRNILEKWNRIAGPEDLVQLRLDVCAKRRSRSDKKPESTLEPSEPSEPSDTSIEGQLKRYQLQYQRGIDGDTKEYTKFVEVPWRLYMASIASLYEREKAARKKEPSKRYRGRNPKVANIPRKSLRKIFIDVLLPELRKTNAGTPCEPNGRFDSWLQHGKRWARLVDYFGSGILLLTPEDLTNDTLRNLTIPEIEALVQYSASYRPAFKDDIKNLTSLLSPLIENRCLPDQRLKLEMLSESQITSGELAAQSLKELLEFSDECSYFLTEAASSNLLSRIEASPSSPTDTGKQADFNMALLGPSMHGPDDPSIISYTDYLLSPANLDMDRFGDDFFFN